ncbi:hypothetical protein DPEC_G00196770 [Dallia pectoralis]|uniref:Uncharacterized protein n=1 Tax=Dallia pectoralis TaxID=75939 RepID=A0ACC2G872_DALPE|nr:hypothetical protein DPEC_G00196770 [Dallia pectoralis]
MGGFERWTHRAIRGPGPIETFVVPATVMEGMRRGPDVAPDGPPFDCLLRQHKATDIKQLWQWPPWRRYHLLFQADTEESRRGVTHTHTTIIPH